MPGVLPSLPIAIPESAVRGIDRVDLYNEELSPRAAMTPLYQRSSLVGKLGYSLSGSSQESVQGELGFATGKRPVINCLRVSPTAMYLRAGPRLPGPTTAAKGRIAPSRRLPRRSMHSRPATTVGASQAASFGELQPHRGVSIFESALCDGRDCRRAGPPPKAGPAQEAVDSAADAGEFARFLGLFHIFTPPMRRPAHLKSCIHL